MNKKKLVRVPFVLVFAEHKLVTHYKGYKHPSDRGKGIQLCLSHK